MQYFFNLFNSEKVENFIYEENKNIKTNLNFFNVKFYLEDLTDLEISDCELIIEKENEGKYNFNNKISGEIEEGLVEFKNVEFKNAIEELSNYRIYFELKQGGITVLSTKKDSINFTLYMKAIDFDINFKDAIKLNDIYELQKENLEELIFEFSVNNFNNFQYYYEISPKEEIAPRDYKILSNNTLLINESLNIEHFKDGFTYLHFFLKDSFENVKYKKYKITTKNNTFTLLNILNKEITLSKLDEEFGIFYESRNITQLKPIIQYKVNGESFQKEGTNIGTFNQDKKMFLLNLKEQFSNIESNEMFLFFILNNNEKLMSNEVFISIDNEEPEVEIQEYYLIKSKEVNELTISGKIIDKNLFFLGNSVKTIKPKTKLLFINSELNLLKVVFNNGEEQYLEKFSNYYTCETKNLTFEVFDVDNNQVNKNNIKYLNTTDENKHFYIWLDRNKLSLFEQNLLSTQNSIKIKGNEIEALIISQEQLVFENIILLKVTLSPTATGILEFDLGIDGLEYSFLYHLNNSNISLEMNNKKQLILDFKNTELIISKSEKTNILKYNNNKILSKKIGIFNGYINLLGISYNKEKFVSEFNSLFFDRELNKNITDDVYFKPTIKKDNKKFDFNFYNCKRISNDIFNFDLTLNVEDGINEYKLIFNDMLENKIEKKVTIEKNYKDIIAELDKSKKKNFNVYYNKDICNIVSRSDTVTIDFIVKNETKILKEKDTLITVKGEDIIKYQKIPVSNKERTFSITFKCEDKEKFFTIYQEELGIKLMKLSIQKKNELYLNSPEKIYSGLNSYNLRIEKDNFAKVSVNFINPNFTTNIKENNIEIIRNNNINMLEELEMEINVFDEEKNYKTISKNIKCYFYNDNLIDEYFILNSQRNLINDYLFDVQFTLNNSNSIEYFRVYDPFESNLRKKFKYGKINGNTCIVEGITTPITPSSFFVEFKIKNTDIVVRQEIFKDNPIKLFNDEENFKVSISFNEKIIVNVIQKEILNYKIKIKENDNLIKEQILNKKVEDIVINKDSNNRIAFIETEILNKNNKIIFFKKSLINFDDNTKHNAKLENFENWNIKSKFSIRNINLINTEENLNYQLLIINEVNEKQKINLNKGNNSIPQLKEGLYIFELISIKYNFRKVVQKYFVEVFDDLEHVVNFSDGYWKFNPINSIEVKNNSKVDFKFLEPILVHITENTKTTINPTYIGNSIKFDFNKEIGLNRFIYKDKIQTIELTPCFLNKISEKFVFIYDFTTKNKTLFFKNDKNIILNEIEDIYFRTKNCDEIIIKPYKLRNEIKRFVKEEDEIKIFKEFIPCEIDFYHKNSKKETIKIELEVQDKLIVPFWNTREEKFINIVPFKIRSNSFVKDKIQLTLKNRTRHFLYNYTIFNAKSLNKKEFLNLNLDEQEEFIKDVSAKVFEQNKSIDIDLLKKEIINELKKLED